MLATGILLLAAALSGWMLVSWQLEHQLLGRARAVADVLDALRDQASRANGYYVRRDSSQDPSKVGRYLASVDVLTQGPEGPRTDTFHQKNPFLVLADLSEQLAAGPGTVRFRMVSDNPMNAANRADRYEVQALREMREQGGAERWTLVGGSMRYVRPLIATAACLACHGDARLAPGTVKALYPLPPDGAPGGGYGFVQGQVMGMTSVTVAAEPGFMSAAAAAFGWTGAGHWSPWILLAAGAAAGLAGLAAAVGLLWHGVGVPLRAQVRYAQDLVVAEDPRQLEPPVQDDALEHTARSELSRLGTALRAIHESLATAQQRLRR